MVVVLSWFVPQVSGISTPKESSRIVGAIILSVVGVKRSERRAPRFFTTLAMSASRFVM